jgi:nucleoside-diphosphate-sugar epimerase
VKNIITTGSRGYLGSKLIKNLSEYKIYEIRRDGLYLSDNQLCSDLDQIKLILPTEQSYVFIHLAAYYSKDELNLESKIIESNLDFGKKVLLQLKHLKLEKIIYTNTMFNYYKDPEIRNLIYTKCKKNFSQELLDFSSRYNILFDEIFLDNTFGGQDNRNKIVPTIIESIQKDFPNPVLNDVFINLTFYKDVVKRIKQSISNELFETSSFVNNKSININSIYDFLLQYKQTDQIEKNILNFRNNDYLESMPKINHFGINLTPIHKELLKLLPDEQRE